MTKMTPAEAIEVLKTIKLGLSLDQASQALDMAIAALPEPLPLTHGILATPKMGCVATHNFVRRPEPIEGLREAVAFVEMERTGRVRLAPKNCHDDVFEAAKRYLELTEGE